MRDVALAVGVFVLSVIGLLWVVANLACAAQFWVSQYHWMKRIIAARKGRDDKHEETLGDA